MGQGQHHRGSQALRMLAHLAIVIVFVLAALGYAPFRERAPGAAHRGAAPPLDAVVTAPHLASARVDAIAHDLFLQKKREVDVVAPDLDRAFKAPPPR